MAVSGATQALIAAFAFGIVVNAGSAALFLTIKGYGSSIFRDGPRLVLITFLLCSALWAQIGFITTIINTNASVSCQVGIAFTTLFDQVARFAIEQFLLWTINTNTAVSWGQMVPQGLLLGRFILGAVFVGLSRPEFNPVCVPTSSVLPVAIVTVSLDAVIIATLAWRAFSSGFVRDVSRGSARSKSVLLILTGLAIWTATSVTMLLGVTSIDYVFRSAIPAAGLSILIIIVTGCSGALEVEKRHPGRLPEAPSPRDIPTSRDLSSSDSTDYPPSRYEDLKREQMQTITVRIQGGNRLPNISQPISGVQGFDGLPVQGQLFPPLRSEVTGGVPTTKRVDIRPQNKTGKGLFGMMGGAAASTPVGKFAISNPILQEGQGVNPLEKIATTDLETALRNDKERRAADLAQRESTFMGKRPAPQPPNVSAEEALKRAVSFKRKDVASPTSRPSTGTQSMSLVANASTTSAQLSPGGEEVRRRSPRQLPREMQPAIPRRPPSPQEIASIRSTTPPQSEVVVPRPQIRPSRQLPPSPEAPPPEPTKTPLQRRPTNGLPGNPRAMGLKTPSAQRQQTVMFVNDIVYNDPNFVQSVMDGASEMTSKAVPIPETPNTSNSVVNRPRPIKRNPDKDRANFYPAEPSPNGHRRSKSGGSIISRKSIFQSNPGSPTQLPPLPPPPKTAGMPERPLPNDTKSMTFDEKMTLFFPAPPSGGATNKRRSSVPEMPPLPASFLENSPTTTDDDARSRRTRNSNRTTKTSIRTENILDVDELPTTREVSNMPSNFRLSPGEYQNLTEGMSKSWLPDFAFDERQASMGGGKRASSPVLPPIRQSAMTADTTTRDDDTTNWGSIHSPVIAQQLGVIGQQARTTYIQKGDRKEPERRESNQRAVSTFTNSEEMTIMLDTSVPHHLMSEPRGSWLMDDENMPMPERPTSSQWHRRVGDECPSFSARKEKTRSRKFPPPAPLLLSSTPSAAKQAILIQAAEPSPLESPEAALKIIQAQLKKYEQPNRDSVESQGQRLALLENLEQEMGLQENHWHEMQHNLGRDSISTIQTSPTIESRRTSAVSTQANISVKKDLAERRASRRARIRSGSSFTDNSQSPSGNSRASLWKHRLEEAQMEYMDNAAELLVKRNMNFFTVPKAQLGSPTPPHTDDSDQEDQMNRDLAAILAQAPAKPKTEYLWKASSPISQSTTTLLWVRPERPYYVPVAEPELPGLSVRPAQRKETAPLKIYTNRLWQKPASTASYSLTGLWQPPYLRAQALARSASQREAQQQSQKAPPPRPLTQRPPRRPKRVTLLPDILESPKPLPDKRGTLGIFQFPWGEKSDTASIQPKPAMFMAMPGTMSTGGSAVRAALEARASQIEASEYSSSFFDDYDEDPNEDSDEMGSDSDDGFDETTLWEIASLLKTDGVPSKNSLFPPPLASSSSFVEDYVNEVPSDREEGDADRESFIINLDDELPEPLAPEKSQPALWTARRQKRRSQHGKGLPHPDEQTWMSYNGTKETARAKPRKSQPAAIESEKLWRPSTAKLETRKSGMWAPKTALWSGRREKKRGAHGKGLPHDEEIWASYDNVKETIRTKPRQAQVATIESVNLWRPATLSMWSRESGLWSPKSALWASGAMKKQKGSHGKGLPHPDMWEAYDSVKSTVRAKPRSAEPAIIESDNLWEHSASEIESPTNGTWSPKKSPASSQIPRLTVQKSSSHGHTKSNLWSAPVASKETAEVGMFNPKSSRSDFRTTSQAPAAASMNRKPRSADHKPMDRLTSTNLWTVEIQEETERNWISVSPASSPKAKQSRLPVPSSKSHMKQAAETKPRPLRQQHRPNTVFRADWEAALREAIAASYPSQRGATPAQWKAALHQAISASSSKRLVRKVASSADWTAALQEAVSKSFGAPFDVSKAHPVFGASSLITTSEWFHPAATGYTYNVANVHPVFFGSLAITCDVEAVHPAMSSYASKKLRRQRSRDNKESRIPTPTRERSLSRSDSRGKRREEILAQIQAIENAVPEVPAIPAAMAEPSSDFSQNAMIMAQIEALEQERLFAEQFARKSMISEYSTPIMEAEPVPELPQQQQLWTKPTEESSEVSNSQPRDSTMWDPEQTPKIVEASAPALASPRDDAESQLMRSRSRSQKEQRRAEILAQIAAIEGGADPMSINGMNEQPMWSRAQGEERKRRESRGGDKDWLEEGKAKKSIGSKIQLRY